MRKILEKGTQLRVAGGIRYEIAGPPIGEGGGSIIYPVRRHLPGGENGCAGSHFLYALKECYPESSEYLFTRNEHGEIVPEDMGGKAAQYLSRIKEHQLAEDEITGQIYSTGFRLTPVLETFRELEISMDGGQSFYPVHNVISIMESLSDKGQSLKTCLKENKHLTAAAAFGIIEQALYAVREVHEAGYLHLDIQDGNIFLKGRLDDDSGMVSLLDFGISRKRGEDGRSDVIEDRVIYSTPGFSAVELIYGNDGTLRLGPEADIYSIGCLLLLLLSGHRFTSRELYTNTTGRYLPRFSIRKTRCPRHLVERMQKILAKALANQVQDRYQSADEMLGDVKEFLVLLQPFCNPLTGMEYDAFICYKHGPVDTFAAKELRNALERYGRGAWRRSHPIRRVFLDEGELASCADFGERIRDALQNSAWLIVLCSQETKESHWVSEEIKTFLEFHPASHILAVVVDGEPGDVYPDIMLQHGLDAANLLAADARGGSLKEIRKKLRGDVKLKIAAPILNMTYDGLKQRDKIYRWKRNAAGFCLGLLALTLFSGYAAVKSRQIAEQAVEITVQQGKALENQARYLVEQARKSYEQNDCFASVEQCLKAHELLQDSGGCLPQLYRLLSQNLGLYRLPFNVEDTVRAAGVFQLVEAENFRETIFTDSEGKHLFALAGDSIYVWDTETFQAKKCLTNSEYVKQFDEGCLLEAQGGILSVGFSSVACFDYRTGSVMWEFKEKEEEERGYVQGTAVSEDGSLVAAADSGKLHVLDAKTGAELLTAGLDGAGEDGLIFDNAAIAFSPDNSKIACTAVKEEKRSYRFLLYDLESGGWSRITEFESENDPGYTGARLHFTEDGRLFLLYNTEGMGMAITDQVYQYASSKISIEMELYDLQNLRQVWKESRQFRFGGGSEALDTAYMGKDALCVVYGSRCEILNLADGSMLDFCDTDSPVVHARVLEKSIELALENGNLLYFSHKNGTASGFEYFSDKIKAFCACGEDYYVLPRQAEGFNAENRIIKYQYGVYDDRYTVCSKRRLVKMGSRGWQKGESEAIFLSDKKEAVSPDWRYAAVLEEDGITLKDGDGTVLRSFTFDEAPVSLFFLPDSSGFLACLETKAVRYTFESGELVETEAFGDNTAAVQGDRIRWHPLDSETVIMTDIAYTHGYMLHIPEDSFGILCEMEDFDEYGPEDDSLRFVSHDRAGRWEEVGTVKRYTEEDIIKKAKEFLGGKNKILVDK